MFVGVFGFAGNSLAADVFYSVGQNTNDHKTGTPTMDIASGTATFSTAQIGNIGVGDKVTYNTTSIAYISSKISQTEWNLVTATGTAPADVTGATVNSISHTFSSLQGAIAGADDLIGTVDLVTGNYTLNIPCYQDSGPDTTAVTIDGYTTGPSNYIKIYAPYNTSTEVNYTQRHQGKWGAEMYNITVSSGDPLTISDEYVIIDGLQIYKNHTDVGPAIHITSVSANNSFEIKNNIIKSDPVSINWQYGIRLHDADISEAKIYNNIIYDFNINGGGYGVGIDATDAVNTYIYNNTIQNCYYGIRLVGGSAIAKNNIVKDAGDVNAYEGTFASGTDYNATDGIDDIGTGSNNKISQTFFFVDESSDDFHLSPTDTAAKNAGVDLSSDPYLPFSTDIDGQARGIWDIGADEAANEVFYSVGQNTDDHKTGTPTVTISGTTVTFSEAQTAANMGVGDVIDYDSDNKKCYISGKTSTTVWSCVSATGTNPTEVTDAAVNSITHAFDSLSAAEAGAPTLLGASDLTSANVVLNIPCYYDSGPDTTEVTISGYTTGPSNYIKIYAPHDISSEVNQSQRHQGKWDEEKYRIETVSPSHFIFEVHENYVKFDGLQMKLPEDDDGGRGIFFDQIPPRGIEVEVSNNVIKGTNPETYPQTGIHLGALYSPGYAKIYNNIIYDTGQLAGSTGINHWHNPWTPYVYNNTVINSYYGYKGCGDNENDFWRNNIAQDCYDGFRLDYGSWGSGSDYNISDIAADAPGTHSKNGTNVSFMDASSDDFHLSSSDTIAKNTGMNFFSDPKIQLSTDVDGQIRSEAWDIGADEAANDVFYSVGQTTDNLMTETPTVTILSGIATFSVAQTGNIGAGDRVTYDASTVAYISGKISQTEWTLTTAIGGVPADITDSTVVSITREYTSLASAIAGATDSNHINNTDIFLANVVLNIPCYYDSGPDTAAVTIDGYTTGLNNYIKIYTPNNTSAEVNQNQRHEGKWDDSKYSLVVTSTTISDFSCIDVRDDDVYIDGLQLQNNKTVSGGGFGINLSYHANTYNIKISNNIIRGPDSLPTDEHRYGIFTLASSAERTFKVWNNIIYDWGKFSNKQRGMSLYRNGSMHNTYIYAYNNTVYNSYIGFYTGEGNTIYLKNNIFYDCNIPVDGRVIDNSSHNLTNSSFMYFYHDEEHGGSAGDKVGQTVQFVDVQNRDFHLSSTDTAAKNAGVDLSTVPNFAFLTDIDGQTRTGSWDIGADETENNVFYSVGQNTNDHKTGTPSVTISGTTVTFSEAQTAANMGVGDVIDYDSDNKKCYISGKTSTTVWSCVSATGTNPTEVTDAAVNSITHAFDSLSAAEAGAPTLLGASDLTSANVVLNIPCYYDSGPDTTEVTISGYTTGPSNYIKIYTPHDISSEVNQSQRHEGKWDEEKYRIERATTSTYQWALEVLDDHVWIDGLQFILNYSHDNSRTIVAGSSISAEENYLKISNNILKGNTLTNDVIGSGIRSSAQTNKIYAWNNIAYGYRDADGTHGVAFYVAGSTANNEAVYYNNTAYGNSTGFYEAMYQSGILKNNLAYNNDTDFSTGFDPLCDYNISSDGTAPGTNSKTNVIVQFADAENYDFHLSNFDTVARDAGTNLSNDPYLAFGDDIDGESRNIGGTWDIGADEAGTSAKIKGGITIEGGVKIFKQ